jgi:uncharacterized protein
MKNKCGFFFSTLLLLGMVIVTSVPAEDMGIITGKKKGTYYQFGLNLIPVVKGKGIDLKVFDSAGSVENVFSVYNTPGIQLGIVQSDVLAFISKIQTDPVLKKIATKMKMVFPLYNEEVHLLAKNGIKEFDDLVGKTVAVGQEGSGIYLTSRILFEVSDVRPREILPIAPDEALAQLKKGKIDAMFYVAGAPVKLFVEDVKSADGLSLVPITSKKILDFYPGAQIPSNMYSWQDQAVNTVAVKAVLMSYDFRKLNCDYVGQFASALQDKLEWLKGNGHPKWKAVDLNSSVKGWEQYDCVRKAIQPVSRRVSPKPAAPNPVVAAIKKMFSE